MSKLKRNEKEVVPSPTPDQETGTTSQHETNLVEVKLLIQIIYDKLLNNLKKALLSLWSSRTIRNHKLIAITDGRVNFVRAGRDLSSHLYSY